MDTAAAPDFVQRATNDAGVKLILRDRQQVDLPDAPPSMTINDFKDVAGSPQPVSNVCLDPGCDSTRSTIAEILYTSGTTAEPRRLSPFRGCSISFMQVSRENSKARGNLNG